MKLRTRTIVLSAAAVLLLAGCGAGADSEPEQSPAPTVTVTAEPVVTEVEVTPQVCLDALTNTGKVIDVMAKIQQQVSPAIRAAAYSDVAALEAITSQVIALNEQTDALMPEAVRTIDACRASAE